MFTRDTSRFCILSKSFVFEDAHKQPDDGVYPARNPRACTLTAAHPHVEVGLVTVDSAVVSGLPIPPRYIWESRARDEVAFPVPGNSTVCNVESSVTDHTSPAKREGSAPVVVLPSEEWREGAPSVAPPLI